MTGAGGPSRRRAVAWALVAVGVIGISASGPLAAATAAPALAVAFWRNALGAAVTAPWAARRSDGGAIGARNWRRCALAGLLLAVHFGCWMPSLRLTSITAATALVCTTPVFTVVLDRITGSRIPRSVLVGVGLALLGVLAITGVDAARSPRALAGDALALAGGVAAAGYIAVGERTRREVTTARYTAITYSACAAALLLVCMVGQVSLAGYSARTWLELIALTVLAQILGHSALAAAVPVVGATPLALAVLLEVPGAALVAWAWLGQSPPVAALPGTALMLAGLAIVVRGRRAAVAEVTQPGADPLDVSR